MCIGTGVTELLTDNVSTDLRPYYRQISTDLCKQYIYLKAYLSAKKTKVMNIKQSIFLMNKLNSEVA